MQRLASGVKKRSVKNRFDRGIKSIGKEGAS